MAAAEIDESQRDEFVAHAVNFDLDDNGYLKKAELQAAADAWNAEASDVSEEVVAEETAEEVVAEEPHADEATEETVEVGEAEEKECPTCSAKCPADAASCSVCFYTF